MKNETCCCSQYQRARPNRRTVISGITGAATVAFLPTATLGQPAAENGRATAEDKQFMRMAIEEARQGDFPFGAVIVRDGAVIARGRNLGRTTGDPTAHGEMVAIRRGVADLGAQALRGATLYTSGEPCAMCMGAILWCGISRLVFAASMAQLATKIDQIMVTSGEIAANAKFDPIVIVGGVLAEEAMQLFQN
jgi:tRNA(adenine34) deaminase